MRSTGGRTDSARPHSGPLALTLAGGAHEQRAYMYALPSRASSEWSDRRLAWGGRAWMDGYLALVAAGSSRHRAHRMRILENRAVNTRSVLAREVKKSREIIYTPPLDRAGDPAPPPPVPGRPQDTSCGLGETVRVVLGCHTRLSTMISSLHTPAFDSDMCPTTVRNP